MKVYRRVRIIKTYADSQEPINEKKSVSGLSLFYVVDLRLQSQRKGVNKFDWPAYLLANGWFRSRDTPSVSSFNL